MKFREMVTVAEIIAQSNGVFLIKRHRNGQSRTWVYEPKAASLNRLNQLLQTCPVLIDGTYLFRVPGEAVADGQ